MKEVNEIFIPVLTALSGEQMEEIRKANNYANAKIKRDQETPLWLQALLTGDPR